MCMTSATFTRTFSVSCIFCNIFFIFHLLSPLVVAFLDFLDNFCSKNIRHIINGFFSGNIMFLTHFTPIFLPNLDSETGSDNFHRAIESEDTKFRVIFDTGNFDMLIDSEGKVSFIIESTNQNTVISNR